MAVELYFVGAILIGGAALAKIAELYKFPYPIFLIIAGLALGTVIEGEDLLAGLGIDFIAITLIQRGFDITNSSFASFRPIRP